MGNLQSEDILIFETGDNWLSKCIAKLTDSNVSHAAMCYQDEKVYYDYPDLVFFAGLIIYRAVRSTKRWQKITVSLSNLFGLWGRL